MKKIAFLIVAISFCVNVSYAQTVLSDFRDNLQLGFKVGANLSNVYDAQGDAFEADAQYGMVIGGFLKIPIGSFLGIQPEVLFSQKGYQGSGKVLGLAYEYSRRTNFIDIPLLIAFKPIPFITLLGGPQYSYLLKQTDDFSSPLTSSQTIQEFKNEDINKNILCFIGGGDINLNKVVLSARMGWDITKNNGDGTSTVPRYKNVWYQATIGHVF